jgi:hypothetical protein
MQQADEFLHSCGYARGTSDQWKTLIFEGLGRILRKVRYSGKGGGGETEENMEWNTEHTCIR